MLLYILPHQLFHNKVKNVDRCIIWEHPHYFTKYVYNKKKLLLHRASMRFFFDTFLSKTYPHVRYIPFYEKHTVPPPDEPILLFDPIDSIPDFRRRPNCTFLESPNFILSSENMRLIYNEQTSRIRFTQTFFKKAKQLTGILVNTESTDKQNRVGKVPAAIASKATKRLPATPKHLTKYIDEAATYVEKHFPDNYGNVYDFRFPISRKQALVWIARFVKHSFPHFGTYQDAIMRDEPYLFHSILSSSLNIGLVHPSDVLNAITPLQSKIPFNSYEAFVRQLFWREFQRYNFVYNKKRIETPTLFRFKNKLSNAWYDATTQIYPVDETIKKAFDTAYLHHIERLMLVGNFMVLNEIKPTDGFRWFMEFAIDSYEWVMLQNVYDMVFFNSNGMTTSKLYISSSNYLTQMTDYPETSTNPWRKQWDKLYKNFKRAHWINQYQYKK